MRRSVAFVVGTLAGTSLLVAAKFGTRPPDATAASGVTTAVVGGAVAVGGTPAAVTQPSERASASPAHKTSAPKPKPTRPPAPTGPSDGTYKASAPVSGGRYGTLSMTVTISDHKIASVSANESGPTEPNCYRSACPRLTAEALRAQSANISAVSGATYTSAAYRAALQAVLRAA